jgi:predicted nucleic acid-binding Zn ribbon protein
MADVERIPQHRHCINCGKAFVGVGNYCTDECRDTSGKDVKKKLGKYVILMIGLVAFTVLLMYWGL